MSHRVFRFLQIYGNRLALRFVFYEIQYSLAQLARRRGAIIYGESKNNMSIFNDQLVVIRNRAGFIAALDQSGGSTPKTLTEYGVNTSDWNNDEEMFAMVHQMRTRIIRSSFFNATRIVGAILFEDTLDRKIDQQLTADYLWNSKHIVPFLKVDQGLQEESAGVQLMKSTGNLTDILSKVKQQPVFGTKMRSLIRQANKTGIDAIVDQQFEIAYQIIEAGLIPIVEPEIDIHCPDKSEAESLLRSAIMRSLDCLDTGQAVILKLTLPEIDNFYSSLISHPNVLKVVALSGGYNRDEANERLSHQHGIIASFSRALAEGLNANQSDDIFDEMLRQSIDSIFAASIT